MKKAFAVQCLILLAIVLVLPLAAEAKGRVVMAAWRWSAPGGQDCAQPAFDDSAWSQLPANGTLKPLERGQSFWLRARVPAADLAGIGNGGEHLYFLSDMSGCAFDLYVNGIYAGSRGRTVPFYDVRRTLSDAFLLPGIVAGSGADLVIALRCEYPGTSYKLPAYALGGAAAARHDSGARNFWNGDLYLMLAGLCAFLGLYFFSLFFSRRQAVDNFHFAMSLVLLSLYFFEMGSSWLPFGSPAFRAVARASLPASIMFLYCFFSTFFAYHSSRAVRAVALGVGGLFYVAFLLVANDDALTDLVFNIGLLPIVATLVFGLLSVVSAVRRGERESLPLLVGIIIGSAFAVHDIVMQVLDVVPFAWLQGLTFFSLDAAIFISMTMRQARFSREFEDLAKNLEIGKADLEASLARIGRAGEAAAAIGRELEAAVQRTETAALRSEKRTAGVDAEALALSRAAEEAGNLVREFIASIGRVNNKLQEEASGIEQTAAAAVELQAGIETSASLIDRTSQFAEGLSGQTDQGEKAAVAMAEAMERVAETARGIREIVDAVNEFAERTNLLAMNASIEAAHAGQAGRGFGVIADEVKRLASAQGDRAGQASALAVEIGQKLEEGGENAERLRTSLRKIAEDAKAAALRMAEARAGAGEQAKASSEVREAMQTLAAAVASIRDEARRQGEYSNQVRDAVAAMVTGALAARESAAAIAQEGSEIARAITNLRALSERSLGLTQELRSK
jgi:methyl-accepting chemotaxis protein